MVCLDVGLGNHSLGISALHPLARYHFVKLLKLLFAKADLGSCGLLLPASFLPFLIEIELKNNHN